MDQDGILGEHPVPSRPLDQDGILGAESSFQPLLQLHVLHSLVPMSEQRDVFHPAPAGRWGAQEWGSCWMMSVDVGYDWEEVVTVYWLLTG